MRSWTRVWMGLFVGGLLSVAAYPLIHPLRADFAQSLQTGPLRWELILLAFDLAVVSALGVSLAFPGRSSQRPLALVSLLGLASLLAYLFWGAFSEGGPGIEPDHYCTEIVLALSVLPMILSVWLTRKLVPTRPSLSAVFTGLFSVLLGATALSFVCPNDHRAHLLVWHLGLPALIAFLVLYPLGPKLFRW